MKKNIQLEYELINVKQTIANMKAWAKEKDRMYLEEKKLAEWAFGKLVKKMKLK